MKKKFFKISLALLVSSTLFFGCKKEEAAASVAGGCGTASASIVNELPVYQAAVAKYSTDPSVANCNAVLASLKRIVSKVKDCPQLTTTYESFLKNYTCGN
ncbi:MAG TPA: hypothetical protein VF273_02580 [Pelobium sp.]